LSADVLMLLTNGFRPDPRVGKEAAALASDGHRVTVLCWDREMSRPAEEEHEGASIRRVRAGEAASMGSFILRYPVFALKCLRKARGMSVDVVHAHDFDTLPLGFLIARLKRARLVFDAHEHYAEMVAMDLPRAASNIIDRIEAKLVRRADLIVTVSEAHAAYLRPNASKLVITENCIDVPEPLRRTPSDRPLTLYYAGTLEPQRYILESMSAAAKLGVDMKVIGYGRLEKQAAELSDGARIRYLGPMTHSQLMKELETADVSLCLLDPANPNYRAGSPNKLYEAMALGVPVIATKGTLGGDVTEREKCGIAIDWSEESFADAVEALKDADARRRMGEAGRSAAVREYNWTSMRSRLIEAYRSLLART